MTYVTCDEVDKWPDELLPLTSPVYVPTPFQLAQLFHNNMEILKTKHFGKEVSMKADKIRLVGDRVATYNVELSTTKCWEKFRWTISMNKSKQITIMFYSNGGKLPGSGDKEHLILLFVAAGLNARAVTYNCGASAFISRFEKFLEDVKAAEDWEAEHGYRTTAFLVSTHNGYRKLKVRRKDAGDGVTREVFNRSLEIMESQGMIIL